MPTTYYKDTNCGKCGGYLYMYENQNVPHGDPDKFIVACQMCGTVFYHGEDILQASAVLGSMARTVPLKDTIGTSNISLGPKEQTHKNVLINDGSGKLVPATMANAYQINKTREICICCGKKTYERPVLTGLVRFCDCVNKLPR